MDTAHFFFADNPFHFEETICYFCFIKEAHIVATAVRFNLF